MRRPYMKIRELVKDLSCHFNTIHGEKICADTDIQGLLDTEITQITNDSRKVIPGSLFFCIVGRRTSICLRRQEQVLTI